MSFFDVVNCYASLTQSDNPLERLNQVIHWKLFRDILAQLDTKKRKSTVAYKPIDGVLMFKILILQNLYNLALEELSKIR